MIAEAILTQSRRLLGPTLSPTSYPTFFFDKTTNSASQSTTKGLVYTLFINLTMFSVLVIVFEVYRHYKQIFLKRYQRRFVETNRIPPEPPAHIFGWIYAVMKVEEVDVLYMVGLDAYMLLRYHVVCLKLCIMLSVCGLVVLLPAYGTVNSTYHQWDKFTLPNVIASSNPSDRDRVWIAVCFGYIFSAYFCQLLYNEYNNFSNERLRCLQANHDGQVNDTSDNLPQKYYTIMMEKIPPELRSEDKLQEYFDELFPGDVHTIEVSLDLRELNSASNRRKQIRNNLEKAIACYISTRRRPIATVRKHKLSCFPQGIIHAIMHFPWLCGYSGETCARYLGKLCHVERYGYEKVDAIDYYTRKLLDYNDKTKDLQQKCFDASYHMKKDIQKKMKNRHDTRAAAAVEKLGLAGNKIMKSVNDTGIESIFFDKSKKRNKSNKQPRNSNSSRPLQISSRSLSHSDLDSIASSDQHHDDHHHDQHHDDHHHDEHYVEHHDALHMLSSSSSIDSNMHHLPSSSSMESLVIAHNDSVYDDHDIKLSTSTSYMALPTSSSESSTIIIHSEERISSSSSEVENPLHQHTNISSSSSSSMPSKPIKSLRGMMKSSSSSRMKSSSSSRVQLLNPRARNVVNRAKNVGIEGFQQAKIAGQGAIRSGLELERLMEMLTVGAYYKYSSTAFVTFKSRVAETIAQQMILSSDNIEISHGPNPHDIIWENVAIPKAQIVTRNNITNVGLIIGSVFWSSLVTVINRFAKTFQLVEEQSNLLSVFIILMFLLVLPFMFDTIARYYEGFKLESEIQNTIMTRYFYYQLVNIYVTIGLGRVQLNSQMTYLFMNPQLFIDLLGKTIPSLSLYFTDLVIVKIFAAIPLEMCRPWQLSTILLMGTVLDRQKLTRRELRTGAFYSWPMLYGWVYPQLLLVTMIMMTYACFAPLMMPFGVLFFSVSYTMYKYQLLYVYVNDNQSLGFMWYAVFNRSLIALLFSSFTLLACFAVNSDVIGSAPFVLTLPLPASILYFWHYCDATLKKTSLDLSFGFAKKIDHRNEERKANKKPVPQDTFKKDLYRQPTLTEPSQYPEPYRKSGESASEVLSHQRRPSAMDHPTSPSNINRSNHNNADSRSNNSSTTTAGFRLRSESINVHAVEDEVEDSRELLEKYFKLIVLRRLCSDKTLEDDFDMPDDIRMDGANNVVEKEFMEELQHEFNGNDDAIDMLVGNSVVEDNHVHHRQDDMTSTMATTHHPAINRLEDDVESNLHH